ncbi:hypothetical protein [Arthrobacter sp. GMC3]|uniref:hypothetical protein n=1 Tax=Arthrobacter sp. GMC3 TaxID=2058894 RepID=UPI000CE3A2E3|nr:hypothetical protein [Arthrobacter sp. GMC3]
MKRNKYPRITEKSGLVELPSGAVILDSHGDVSQLRGDQWCSYETEPMDHNRMAKYLPANILYNPQEK